MERQGTMAEEPKKMLRCEMTDQRLILEAREKNVRHGITLVQDHCEKIKGLVYDVMESFPEKSWEDKFVTLWKELYATSIQMSVVADAAGLKSPELSKPGDQ